MHIFCQQEDLAAAVSTARRAVAARTTIPVLTGILLEAKGSALTVEATDIELRIRCEVPAEVKEEGQVVLPARHFCDLVRFLPGQPVEIITRDEAASIKYGESVVKLNGFPVEEFPELKDASGEIKLSVSPDLMVESIRQVSVAASRDISRPVLTGVLFNIEEDGQVTLVATDSHRLTKKHLRVKPLQDYKNLQAIIPSRVLNELSRAAGGLEEEEILIAFGETVVCFKCGFLEIYSQLIDGQFPHYKDVIPKSAVTTVELPTEDFLNCINRASLMSMSELKGRGSVIKMNIEGEKLSVYSYSTDVGEVNEKLELIHKQGEDVQIAFNAKYLLDVLRVLDCENIKIEFTGPLSPALIKPANTDSFLYLVLPIRTQ